MNEPKVSIIVPVYNTAKFLEACLSSITDQSYKNIEIIIVNDGSTDDSLEICSKFAKQDNRVKLISQKNSGVAAARNKGFLHSTGDYIIHADSDDELPTDAIESLCSSALESNADIVIADYITQTKRTRKIVHINFTGDKNLLLRGILTGQIQGSLWNKLLKRSLYNLASFEPGLDFTEDKLFLCRAISRSSSLIISHVRKPVYIYKIRTGSYTTNFSEKSLKDFSASTEILCTELKHLYESDFLSHLKLQIEVLKIINTKSIPPKEILNKIYSDHRISFSRRLLVWLTTNRIPSPLLFYKKIKTAISYIK